MRRTGLLAALVLPLALTGACGDDSLLPRPPDARGAPPDASMLPPADAGPPDATPPDADTRRKLSGEGLYSNIATKTISPSAVEYTVNYPLWADGAGKRRWIILPPGTKIDTTDMDHWVFPVGTKFFKEFALPDGTLLETRLVERVDATTYFMGSFVWLPDDSDAIFQVFGATGLKATDHDAPKQTQCFLCHNGEAGKILGFSAIQLSHDGTFPTVKTLATMDLLTALPPVGTDFPIPGTPVDQAALGYLHANCGHCHNPTTSTFINDTHQVLRLSVNDTTVQTTQTYLTTVNVMHDHFLSVGHETRIVPGDPSASLVLFRMLNRGGAAQMPPIATKHTDPDGINAVTTWIMGLM